MIGSAIPLMSGQGAGNPRNNTHQPAARAYKRDGILELGSSQLQRAMLVPPASNLGSARCLTTSTSSGLASWIWLRPN